jgi:hypothetical protein
MYRRGANGRNETYLLVLWRTVLYGSRGKLSENASPYGVCCPLMLVLNLEESQGGLFL